MSLRQDYPTRRDPQQRPTGRRALLTSRKLWKTAALAFPVLFVAEWLVLLYGAVLLEKVGVVMSGTTTMGAVFLVGVLIALLGVLHKRWGATARAVALAAGISAILIAAQITEL
ncbi:hypothetical protein [Nocardia huaxiensis]|uniref:Uncharacterized protein n=1 Tax=Nocardia huaxiensis TaxID=2755382 RepID=A0A7D6ZMK9_9NOCA|nr:hypothetical protein [Nocardia huaxiensis]QLY29345.1 hypothetical protein H0264_29325 [Nocardia huaxiensis]UFS97178.1 hypothetical protein LPY97_04410 [Nocardia huaxiensis]